MTLTELRHLYRDNELVEAIIEPINDGVWGVEFRHVNGGFMPLTDSRGEACHYDDLDSASKFAMAVGFRQVRVEAK